MKPITKPQVAELPPKVRIAKAKARVEMIPWLLVAPALLVFVLLFVIPLVNLFLMSLSPPGSIAVVIPKAGPANYTKFLTDSFYLGILWRTVKLAFMTVVVSLLIGYPLAYYIAHSTGRKRAYLTLLVLAPLLVNVLVRTFGWIVVLGPTGLVSWVLQGSGLSQEPVNLLFTETAIVVGLVQVDMAYMILAVAASLQNIDPSLRLAAQNLGASRLQTFLRITLPLSLPGVVAGSLLVFALGASAFATPALLGGPRNKVMSYLVYQQTLFLLNWSFGAAIAFILMFSVGILVFIYLKTIESGRFAVVFR